MKRTLILLAGNALAAFMDFGIGTAIATVIAHWYGVGLPWCLIILGGVLSLVPDFDLVPSVIRGAAPSFDHRQSPFHRPLLVLPLAITLAYLFGGQMWALIAGICVAGHYLHDTNFVGTNYGIAWFWPFSHQYWSTSGSFTPELNIGTHYEWLARNWLRPSTLSIREIAIGLGGISIALWLFPLPLWVIITALLFFIVCVKGLWMVVSKEYGKVPGGNNSAL